MAILNQVKQMKQQGRSKEEITQKLKEQGHRALEISQALEQAKIKAAISPDENAMTQQATTQQTMTPPKTQPLQQPATEPLVKGEMQPSITEMQPQEPMPQEPVSPIESPAPEAETPEYIYPTPQAYGGYGEYQPYTGYQPATETTTEIAEQIAEEKIGRIRKDLSSLSSFKTTAQSKIKNIDERLKKIEEMIDKLQASIIGKIGSFGQNLQDIKKEMILTQQSFSKALPQIAKKKTAKRKTKRKKGKKKKSGIEHYLKR